METKPFAAVVFIGLCCLPVHGYADHDRVFTLHIDNDILYGTDREYTAGIKARVSHPAEASWLFSKVDDWLKPYSFKPFVDQTEACVEVYTLRQTQQNSSETKAILNEAWTHIDFRRLYQRNQQSYVTTEVALGWLGPSSPGRPLQNDFHKLIGNQPVDGWDDERPDQATLMVSLGYQEALKKWGDFALGKGAWISVGTPESNVSMAFGGMYGRGTKPVLFNGELTYVQPTHKKWGYFVYGFVGYQYIMHSTLLDGRPLTDDVPLVKHYPHMPFAQYGAGLAFENFTLSMSGNVVSQIYEGQPESRFRYASITASWVF